MTYKKNESGDFNEFQITERNVNGFSDLNLHNDTSFANEAFSMDGETGMNCFFFCKFKINES